MTLLHNDEIPQNLAERLCWEVARRDDARLARRLYRKQLVDGGYRLDEGAVLDDFFNFLDQVGVMALLAEVHGAAIQRAMLPCVQYVLLYSLKTLFGIESINALPTLLFSDEALMQLVGFNAPQLRDGMCQRGTAKQQWDLGHPPQKTERAVRGCRSCSPCSCLPWPRPIGCSVSGRQPAGNPSGGNAGAASSSSRPVTR
jgi:hypothetical protein